MSRVMYQMRLEMRPVTMTLLVSEIAYCVVAKREKCATKMLFPAPNCGRSEVAVYVAGRLFSTWAGEDEWGRGAYR